MAMPVTDIPGAPAAAAEDLELAHRVAQADHEAFERLMRQNNGKLFRIARSILRDDADAEDALQDAYLDAYRHITSYRGGSRLSTWLTRIVINHALMRLRKDRRDRQLVPFPEQGQTDTAVPEPRDEHAESPDGAAFRAELRRLIERRIDELPEGFRTVLVMRDLEEMSSQEIAECLDIPPATVRTRLFRARAMLRASLARDVDLAATNLFGFAGARCDRIVARVLARLQTGSDLIRSDQT
ncbi:MAG TPA: RNA polymerase sigma factor [Vicinamibacterales bacterium]